MSSIGSVGVLLVWASQCLAYVRYHRWYVCCGQSAYALTNCYSRLWIHRAELIGEHEKFQRWPMKNNFSSYFSAIQPVPAYLGLISCLIIVFIFSSAEMW